jgi:hypothetical protein
LAPQPKLQYRDLVHQAVIVALSFEVTAPPKISSFHSSNLYTNKMASNNDLFSRFVNWLSSSGPDKTALSREGGNTDLFSRFMNRISG